MKGLKLLRNSQGLRVIRLHYSADSRKDPETTEGKKWIDKKSNSYLGGKTSLDWRREMEIDFTAGRGELVFGFLPSIEEEIFIDPFRLDSSYKFYGGLDWGTRNPTAFIVVAESIEKEFFVVWEHYEEEKTALEVAKAIHRCPFYPMLEWIAYDPSMATENQNRKDVFTSIIEIMQDQEEMGKYVLNNLMPSHGRSDVDFIEKLKLLWNREFPTPKIFKTCYDTITELRGLKYPERREKTNETEKILDKNNHAWDAMKYVFMSHPWALQQKHEYKKGTLGYLNKMAELAEMSAAQNGRSVQEEFNDVY